MSYIESAFHVVCRNAKPAEGFYVSLMEKTCRYGGPEEGGWWTNDSFAVAYEYFPTREQADSAASAVERLACELEADATREHGERCLREMDWLDDRGLEADWLPEPDGPSEFYVLVTEGLPESSYGPTRYE